MEVMCCAILANALFTQPRKPGSLYFRGLRQRPWLESVRWDSNNLLPKGEWERYQISCFHNRTLPFICKERDILYNIQLFNSIKIVQKQREKVEYECEKLAGLKIHELNKIYSLRTPSRDLYS